jgi:hypothetical protein
MTIGIVTYIVEACRIAAEGNIGDPSQRQIAGASGNTRYHN